MATTLTFDNDSIESWVDFGKQYLGASWDEAVEVVLLTAHNYRNHLPKLRFPEGTQISYEQYLKKWIDKYVNGYRNRPSERPGNPPGTVPDTILKIILSSRLPNLEAETIDQIADGHVLAMAIENLVGNLLEEYLSIKLAPYGWFCCWGTTMVSIDFCKANGDLLQIKNSDNSENSSSSQVRTGTTIEKWQRRNSKKVDQYYWKELNEKVGATDLSEDDFRSFVLDVINKNPSCLFISNTNILTETN